MSEHYFKFRKTGRYYLSGPLTRSYSLLCFVLHGYGQLASYFIRKFQLPELEKVLFVAPEGMHRFYLPENKERVGASWMTKEDRLNDIADYCCMLDQVYEEVLNKMDKPPTIGLLAFSQGVATACRWLAHSAHPFDYMVNWAGAFPPDLDFKAALERMRKLPLYMVAGTGDEFISEERLEEHLAFLKEKGFQLQLTRFKGGHTILPDTLLEVMQKLLSP
ncbi:MAG TPA: phospholipase [Cryomorphaceae bacterium]|nr:phospholipase [Cryomorphaceae bacterium]